jgi:phosphoribosyl-ATP pyrophosphohydrolase/phosphoribosyl-AMP cyclohydrolase
MTDQIHYDARGLAPAVVQDAETGQVLMLAWMNAEAVQKTLETGEAHFWSRSRRELWHKGATSGNVQRVAEIRLDCDADALLLRVRPAGPACHTGEVSCFYRTLGEAEGREVGQTSPLRAEDGLAPEPKEAGVSTPGFSIHRLYEVICDRRDHPAPGSYTTSLFAKGEDEIVKKVGEEAIEVILAAKAQGTQRLVEEVADLSYHLLVLLAANGLSPGDIEAELARRHR